eukprot:scaffold19603_cov70-Isochrysis_galbana.AAC.2
MAECDSSSRGRRSKRAQASLSDQTRSQKERVGWTTGGGAGIPRGGRGTHLLREPRPTPEHRGGRAGVAGGGAHLLCEPREPRALVAAEPLGPPPKGIPHPALEEGPGVESVALGR